MSKKTTFLSIATALLLTFNANSQWTSQTSGTSEDLKSISFPSANIGYAVGLTGTVLKTTNGGTTWATLSAPIVQDLYKVLFIDDNVGLVFGDGGKIYKTTDGGTSWNVKVSGTSNAFLTACLFNDETTIFAAGASGTIKKSTDAGETWTNITSGTTEDINAISFEGTSNTTGYFVGNNAVTAYAYKTTDSGTTWTSQMLTGNVFSFFGLSVIDAGNAFFCGGASAILKTSNGGTSWSNVNSSTASFYRSCLFSSASTGYVVGGNGKIIKTTNGGTSYTPETTGTTSILNSIVMTSCGAFFVVGNGGVILKKGTAINGVADTYAGINPAPLVVTANNGVLANDGQTSSTVAVGTTTTHGTLLLNADGSFTYTPNVGYLGNDQFTYIISDACGNTSSPVTVTISSTASLEQAEMEQYKIYPNPAGNTITISNTENLRELSILNLQGEVVYSTTNMNSPEFTISQLKSGVYLLSLKDIKGACILQKVNKL